MKAQKAGLIIFWIGTVYMVVGGFVGSWLITPALRNLTLAQYSETIWSWDGALFWIWAFSLPLGSILVGVGILLYVRAKSSLIWLFGIGVFIILGIVERVLPSTHFPPVFGIGGGLILGFFLAILWFWAKKYKVLEGSARAAAYFQLVSYAFFFIAMWFLCQTLGAPFLKVLEGEPPSSPISIIIYLVLGWLFLFLSHYKSAQAIQK